jgi:hypothetical protein
MTDWSLAFWRIDFAGIASSGGGRYLICSLARNLSNPVNISKIN